LTSSVAAVPVLLSLTHTRPNAILVAVEAKPWALETAIEGDADRLTPILMTSLVTALGVLPLAIGMDDPGREIEGPMAVVILGGLLTSLALNLPRTADARLATRAVRAVRHVRRV
jgi:Cu/Ag efflux pump CusA